MENIKKINKSKRYNKDFELVLLTVALLMTADHIDYKNSFKTDVEEVSVVSEYNDYSNFLTRAGSNLNSLCETFMNSGIKKTLKILSELFYE